MKNGGHSFNGVDRVQDWTLSISSIVLASILYLALMKLAKIGLIRVAPLIDDLELMAHPIEVLINFILFFLNYLVHPMAMIFFIPVPATFVMRRLARRIGSRQWDIEFRKSEMVLRFKNRTTIFRYCDLRRIEILGSEGSGRHLQVRSRARVVNVKVGNELLSAFSQMHDVKEFDEMTKQLLANLRSSFENITPESKGNKSLEIPNFGIYVPKGSAIPSRLKSLDSSYLIRKYELRTVLRLIMVIYTIHVCFLYIF